MAAFNSTLMNEVDLDQLCEQLLRVIQETMQPMHISLWLCRVEQAEVVKRQVEFAALTEDSEASTVDH